MREWELLQDDSSLYRVFDDRGDLVAELVKTIWGKWKIRYEDTYGKTPQELVKRLKRRQQ